MENKVSIAMDTYPNSGKYQPMINSLGESLHKYYGVGVPRGAELPTGLKPKAITTKIATRISAFVINPIVRFFKLPLYYSFWVKVRILDSLFANRVARDGARVLFTTPLFLSTVRKAKKAGKIVVLEAGNSEPAREHQRIMDEYKAFHIRHKYIYGNPIFRDTCLESFKLADKIITISKVSRQTYIDAGFPTKKLEMIPLTGTDYPIHNVDDNLPKQCAFISTAFHNFIKGTHRLLLAWEKAQIEGIPLIIVGRICEDLQEFIESHGPFKNVIYAGHQSNLRDYYSTRDAVGVLLSLSEGAVRVTPEMMSYGYPMITSPDATCDLVKDGVNGFIIDPTDIDGIANRLKWFAEDWNRVHEMRANVLKSVSNRSLSDWSLEVSEYLQSLL